MSFESEFLAPFKRDIERKVKAPIAAVVGDTAEEVLGSIIAMWPKDTFWSDANHRVNVGVNPQRDFPLEPPERPKEAGALQGEAADNEEQQVVKLRAVKFGEKVLIGNSVPYAADVGGSASKPNKGNGTRIYIEAGAAGAALASSRLGQ